MDPQCEEELQVIVAYIFLHSMCDSSAITSAKRIPISNEFYNRKIVVDRPVKYHNWRHALNVAQTMFAMLKTGKMEQFMTDLEILGLLVACLCHDLDHRGTNNAFQTKTESPLAILYSTSTMEHHHFDQCVMILNSDSNNIFQSLSMEDYRRVMKVVESAILSTDLAMYFKKRNRFMELIDEGEFDWQSEEKKERKRSLKFIR